MINAKEIEAAIADLKEKGNLPFNFKLEEICRIGYKIYFWGTESKRNLVWFWNEKGECFCNDCIVEKFVTFKDDIIQIREGLLLKRYEECDVIIF